VQWLSKSTPHCCRSGYWREGQVLSEHFWQTYVSNRCLANAEPGSINVYSVWGYLKLNAVVRGRAQ